MYQIQLQEIRADLDKQLATLAWDDGTRYDGNHPILVLGGSQDSATAFMIAADADALASRLMNCADARLAQASAAIWGSNIDALYFNVPAALNQSARALYLVEKAGEAKQFSERMLDVALLFERAGYLGDLSECEGDYMAALDEHTLIWSELMAEGIFSTDMYAV